MVGRWRSLRLHNTLQAVNMEPLEEYHSPFDFEQGVNASYLYLSPAYSDTPPSSPAVKTRGNHKEERERLGGGCEECVCVCVCAGQKEKNVCGSPDRENLEKLCVGQQLRFRLSISLFFILENHNASNSSTASCIHTFGLFSVSSSYFIT